MEPLLPMARQGAERPTRSLEVVLGTIHHAILFFHSMNKFWFLTRIHTNSLFLFSSGNEEGAGLLQRALRDIFDKIAIAKAEEVTAEFDDNSDEIQKQNSKTTFKGSFFEIFNERVYDLLSSDSLEKALPVREDSNGVYVEGLKEDEVRDMHDAESLLAKGLANRHVASTNMNRTSSRSHALFVLSVKTEHTTPDGLRKIRNSKFTLVDLAGSERQKSTGKFLIYEKL